MKRECGRCGAERREVSGFLFCLLCDCPAGTMAAMKAAGATRLPPPPVIPGPDGAKEPGE